MLTGKAGVLIMAGLWLLMCLRFWRLAGPKNPGQRHLIALAGGLGAGLIYLLGTLMLGILNSPGRQDAPPSNDPASPEDIRIRPSRTAVP